MDLMELNTTPTHHAKALPDSERKAIIEAYPPMAHLDYRAPAIIPTAERMMNRGQKYENTAIKQLQYLLSAAFRPLDILIHEMFTHENGNPNLERYSTMLRDIHRLLLHQYPNENYELKSMGVEDIFKIVNAYTDKFKTETQFTQWTKSKANYTQVPFARKRKSGVSVRVRNIYVLKPEFHGN
ncbi:hypothetical protein MUCCIDRAFT_158469 [Mucor lusitanicus CBS 277.49]|uniref:Uncharacterized protein n=1 Tax=Mucor lusitanicus CBS 277.49 TaxID=747725 RepID=A0A168PUF3_MUCCL|nr:hypothetical protein MUCCIDRAFT_158469 [Mucor lusitanicus CBS 277.49]